MKYTYIKSEHTDGQWKDNRGHPWGYQKNNNHVIVFGDVKRKNRLETNDYLNDENARIAVEPCRKKLGFFSKEIGYIQCIDEDEQKGCIRIVQASKKRILIVLLIILILLGGGFFGLRELMRPSDDTPIRIASGEMTNPNPENIRLPGIEKIFADAGSTHVEQLLLNVEGNAYNLQYTITLEETGEEIYQSKIIEPGYGVREFDMNRSFESGEYPILITVNSSAQEDEQSNSDTAYNAGQLEAVLVVE